MGLLQVQRTWLDRAVGYLSPRSGLERMRARAQLAVATRNFEAASRSERLSGWRTAGQKANTPSSGDLETLRARSRALTRNNGWAKQALRVIANNVVGRGIVPRLLGDDDARKERVAELWKAWAVASKQADTRGRRNLYGLQRLVMRTVAESGECLVRRRPRRASDGLAVPLQLEVIEPDFLDTTRDGATRESGEIIQGVEFDALDRVRGYWLFRKHPGDMSRFVDLESRFVPASEILHVFDEERAGQVRGVPVPTPAIVRLHDYDEAEDARLMAQKIAACFVALVHDLDAGLVDTENVTGEPMRERVEPGMLWKIPPGKDVKFGSPPAVGEWGEYSSTVLRGVAAAYGITYEELSGDYSRVNFSSGRMGWIQANRNVQTWQTDVMVPGFCLGVWRWWADAAELETGLELDGVEVSWDAPRREMLDPVKETTARMLGVRAGFLSLSDAIREGGRDPRETLRELSEDARLLEEFGLSLTTDPRGVAGPEPPTEEPPAKPDGDDEDDEEEAEEKPARSLNGRASGAPVVHR